MAEERAPDVAITLKEKLIDAFTGLAVLAGITAPVAFATQQSTQVVFTRIASGIEERVRWTNQVLDVVNARAVAARIPVLATSAEGRSAEQAAP